jgi:hypothetical protein
MPIKASSQLRPQVLDAILQQASYLDGSGRKHAVTSYFVLPKEPGHADQLVRLRRVKCPQWVLSQQGFFLHLITDRYADTSFEPSRSVCTRLHVEC